MYVVTFDQPEYWIRRGLNEVSSLTKRWPASFFNTIEDDGVRPAGYEMSVERRKIDKLIWVEEEEN